jgi:hypothetical protein
VQADSSAIYNYSTQTSTTITGLIANSVYVFTLKLYNRNNSNYVSKTLTLSTLAFISNITSTLVNNISYTITWTSTASYIIFVQDGEFSTIVITGTTVNIFNLSSNSISTIDITPYNSLGLPGTSQSITLTFAQRNLKLYYKFQDDDIVNNTVYEYVDGVYSGILTNGAYIDNNSLILPTSGNYMSTTGFSIPPNTNQGFTISFIANKEISGLMSFFEFINSLTDGNILPRGGITIDTDLTNKNFSLIMNSQFQEISNNISTAFENTHYVVSIKKTNSISSGETYFAEVNIYLGDQSTNITNIYSSNNIFTYWNSNYDKFSGIIGGSIDKTFEGSFDNFMIYDRVLSFEEIKSLYFTYFTSRLVYIETFINTKKQETSLEFQWSGGNYSSINIKQIGGSTIYNITNNIYSITGLTANTSYSYEAIPVHSTGITGKNTIQILNLYTLPVLSTFTTSYISNGLISFQWSGNFSYVKIFQYGLINTSIQYGPSVTIGTITNLSEFATYTFEAFPYNISNDVGIPIIIEVTGVFSINNLIIFSISLIFNQAYIFFNSNLLRSGNILKD